jgi:hypothetical protein
MSQPADIKRPIAAISSALAFAFLVACSEPPPPSMAELLADPVLLDATMVRCLEQHDATNYAPECISAREAAGQLALAAEQARQAELEAESERKREALRRAQEAADAARQQALALAEQRETAEYLGLLPTATVTTEASPAETEELHFITIDAGSPAGEPGFTSAGEDASPQVTVQEIDLGALMQAAPPEPEPEAE